MRQSQGRLRSHIDHGTSGYVVEHNRDFDRFGNGAEMLVQPLLRRFVVVRHYGHDRVHAQVNDLLGEGYAVCGAVVAGVRYDFRATVNRFEHRTEEVHLLIVEDSR